MSRHHILQGVAQAYGVSRRKYETAQYRGDTDRADQALSEMQEIERCVTVIETSTAWRSIGGRDG